MSEARPGPDAYLRDQLFIGGGWQSAHGEASIPVYDCSTEQRIGSVRSATPKDVAAAVRAAQSALPGWRILTPAERGKHLRALNEQLRSRAEELAAAIAAEVGTALRMSRIIQVASAIDMIEITAEVLDGYSFAEEFANSIVVQEPAGVVAAITPWNYPLFQTIAKVAGALAAGCTVVHKPSELAPISAVILAECVAAAGLPAGLYNLVTGTGPVVGEALAAHPGVRMVSFTGSTASGSRVYELASRTIKRVALELGGKSASVLLEDADVLSAVKATVGRAFLNSGQTCDAWTRLIVPRRLESEVLEVAEAAAQRLPLGDPFDPATRLGPLISARQRERVAGYVAGSRSDGARVVVGGESRPGQFERGHYFRPTVLAGVTPSMRVAQEEVFGPVLAVMTYDSAEEALQIANGTEYGLSGAVWSGDADRALEFGRRMEAGQVVINGGKFNPLAPFGGMKRSGVGREMGRYGLEEFLEPKALQR